MKRVGFLSGVCLVLLAVLLLSHAVASAETLLMPNRDALKGTQLVVWGTTTLPVGSTYTIAYGDGTAVSGPVPTDRSYIATTKTYYTAGVHTVTFTVTSGATTETATATLQVFDPALLSAPNLRAVRVNMAIQDGLRYLWTAQISRNANFPASTTTAWGASFYTAYTSLVVLAFENHGYRVPTDNSPATGVYEKYVVQRGLNYIFDNLYRQSLTNEPAGDPCVGAGVEAAPCTGLRAEGYPGYSTSVATLAIAGSGAPSRTVSAPGTYNTGFVTGRNYGEIVQRLANTVVWAQSDSGVGQGGWTYSLDYFANDGSTMGWAVLALLDAQASGATIPDFAKTQVGVALSKGLNNDGTLDYQADGDPTTSYWANVQKTAIGLQALFFTGAPIGDEPVGRGINYINSSWTTPIVPPKGSWVYGCSYNLHNKGCGYAMFNVFKAFRLYGITALPAASDWYAEYVDYLLGAQRSPTLTSGGNWSPGSAPTGLGFSQWSGDISGIVALAELILSPVALVLPANLTLAPPTATNYLPQQDAHTVTATATATNGAPVPGASVTFTVLAGPNAGVTGSVSTDAAGQASFTYTSGGNGGTDTIRANIGALQSNSVEKIWIKNQPPVAQCQDVTVAADAACKGAATTAQVDNGSSDPDQDPLTMTLAPAGPYTLGANAVSLNVDDGQGHTSMCQATVTVVDQTAPAITCGPDQSVECTGNRSAPATVTAAATDNCDPALNPTCAGPPAYPVGQTTSVTCTAQDAAGNASSCDAKVTVVDTRPPAVTCGADQTVECTGNRSATATMTATATDVCDGTVAANCPGPAPYPVGQTTPVTCAATDGSGNTGACTGNVTVVDTTPPAITCGPDARVECTGNRAAPATVTATATDVCDGTVSADCATQASYPVGQTTVACSARDAASNAVSCNVSVTVVDTRAPALSCAAPQTVECTGNKTAPATVTATATDVCEGTLTASCNGPAAYPVGTTNVTCSATDTAGNAGTCATTVAVVDTRAPAVICAAPQTVECTGNRTAPATVTATATDACEGALSASCNGPAAYPVGQTPVACSATDAAGNTGSCGTAVTVVDTRAPAVSCAAPQTVECTGNNAAPATVTATATDVCDGTLSASCATLASYPMGQTPVACSARDLAGNGGACTTSVTVVDTTAPAVACRLVARSKGHEHDDDDERDDGRGLYQVSASEVCSQATITLGGVTLANGEIVRIRQSKKPGVKVYRSKDDEDDDRDEPRYKRFKVGPGEGVIKATDVAGNVGTAACPFPPKRGHGHDDDHDKSKGNNGVGNGEDPQPRGNPPVNDGPGTAPGNPGNRRK